MSGPSWTLPAPDSGASGLPASEQRSQDAVFFGEDIWFEIAAPDVTLGQADYVVTASGDLALATGHDALRQSLIRRLVTNPGEWPTLPSYGVGARLYVKARNTPSVRAELESKIRTQFLRDPRVHSVDLVSVVGLTDGSPGLKISISVTPRGRLRVDRPLSVQVEIR